MAKVIEHVQAALRRTKRLLRGAAENSILFAGKQWHLRSFKYMVTGKEGFSMPVERVPLGLRLELQSGGALHVCTNDRLFGHYHPENQYKL